MRVKLPIPAKDSGEAHVHQPEAPPWTGPPHRHVELELNLVTRGHATYLVRARRSDTKAPSAPYRIRMCADSVVWLFRDQDHMLIERSADFQMMVAVFRPWLVKRVCRAEPRMAVLTSRNPVGHFTRILPAESRERLLPLFLSLTDSTVTTTERDWGMRWLLASAWRAYESAVDVPSMADVHPAVERATFLLRDNPGKYDLPTLADEAGASPAWLSRLFQRQLGISVTDFRNRQRVARFISLYRSGKRQKLTTAAFAAGFNSYPQFYRVFREFTGISPVAYQAQMRSAQITGSLSPPAS